MNRPTLLGEHRRDADVALLGPDVQVTYGELDDLVEARAADLARSSDGLILHPIRNDIVGIVTYLAALRSHRPIALLDPATDGDALRHLVELYRPAVVVGSAFELDEYRLVDGDRIRRHDPAPVDRDLAVLLPTSGSTGSPKMVRLSLGAIVSNAASISESLMIEPGDRAPANLPLHYSYGLSVLNSHLFAGASAVPLEYSFMQREFWDAFDDLGCSSLAGVPYSYQMLRRLRFSPADHPTLRTMTQAGGRLADSLVAEFHERATGHGVRFHVMYGQTEATARMAVLQPDDLPAHLGAAGRAIPDGRFEIIDGEVVYEGPNVMMGYATSAADLNRSDDLGGRLSTGDLGELDDEGVLRLTGRAKRIGKVFGTRVSLDDVEDLLSAVGPSAVVASDDKVIVYLEASEGDTAKRLLRDRLRLPPSGFDVRVVDKLPRRANGKTDYGALADRS